MSLASLKKEAEREAKEVNRRIAQKKSTLRREIRAEAISRRRNRAEICQRDEWQTYLNISNIEEIQQRAERLHALYMDKVNKRLEELGFDADNIAQLPEPDCDAFAIC